MNGQEEIERNSGLIYKRSSPFITRTSRRSTQHQGNKLIKDITEEDMDKIFDTDATLLKLDKKGNSIYFIDFLQTDSFEVGVLRLNPGQKDTQGPHSEDELYIVMEGKGYVNMVGENYEIKKGSCIFVPSKTKHYFHGNKERLVVLYVFNVSNNNDSNII